MSPEAVLDALAASVADGQPVDWRQLEADAAPRDRRLLRHLRLVENISSLYRSIPDVDETVDDSAPEGPRWGWGATAARRATSPGNSRWLSRRRIALRSPALRNRRR